MMRVLIAILGILFVCGPLAASELRVMQIGRDTHALDRGVAFELFGRRVILDEPGVEDAGHDIEFFNRLLGDTDIGMNLTVRRSTGLNNAMAAIRNGERYVVYDPEAYGWGISRYLVFGHEVGHHVCGHTVGTMAESPWARELEADRYAGAVLRRMDVEFNETSLQGAFEAATNRYPVQGSPTHPPLSQRMAAILDGYQNGSSCNGSRFAGRKPSGQPSGNRSSGWDHNGSIMHLAANGADRRFAYATPRSGLEAAGIKSGTPVFIGKKVGMTYNGVAYIYSARCGATAYNVSGPVSEDQRAVTLYGSVPVRDAKCRVIGARSDTLIFTFLGP